jgi:YD repeat-containing protein
VVLADTGTTSSSRVYNGRGLVSSYFGNNKTTTYTYDADDRTKTQVTGSTTSTYDYFGQGSLKSIVQTTPGQSTVTFNYVYAPRESYREIAVVATTSGNSATTRSGSIYDYRGNRVSVAYGSSSGESARELVYNLNGQLLQSTAFRTINNVSTPLTTLFAYSGQAGLGSQGEELVGSTVTPVVDFEYNHTPISDGYPAFAPGSSTAMPACGT